MKKVKMKKSIKKSKLIAIDKAVGISLTDDSDKKKIRSNLPYQNDIATNFLYLVTIKHKFRDFQNNNNIETLILGTFNPDSPDNNANFFYGRSKNYLWNLLPKVYSQHELKTSSYSDKISFLAEYKIGFTDIIEEVLVESDNETNYADDYIDSRVTKWIDFDSFMMKYPNIKKVFLTRKTFNGIPNMKKHIEQIKEYCLSNNIRFFTLPTPARFENESKLDEWKQIFSS